MTPGTSGWLDFDRHHQGEFLAALPSGTKETLKGFIAEIKNMKLNLQSDEETHFIVLVRHVSRATATLISRSIQKPWLNPGLFGSAICKTIPKLRNAIKIPVGYQAETGFQVGVEPAEEEAS